MKELDELKEQDNTSKKLTYTQEVEVGNGNIKALVTEEMPIYNVEPKFKVGDWVVFNNKHQSIYQVEIIEDGYYILRHTYGGTFRVCVLHNESLRLWTIEDAKDGDVLVDVYGNIGIFEKRYGINWHTYFYLGYKGRFISEGGSHGSICYPATKEQRDFLSQKMKEAGYMWDEERKELKHDESK
jgi:hypothetical protein